MRFITFGDSGYYRCIKQNVSQIKKFYPSAKIYVIDIGFDEGQTLPDVNVIKLDYIKTTFGWTLSLKPKIIQKYMTDNLVFMDGDAILLKPIDELFKTTKDLIITTRESRHGKVNSGVIIFRKSLDVQEWIDKTIFNLTLNDNDKLSEQRCFEDYAYKQLYHEVPCHIYNSPEVHSDCKVLHLKCGRHKDDKIWNKVMQLL